MTEEQAFITAILTEPNEEVHRLVFADWLEERDDPRASVLRRDDGGWRCVEEGGSSVLVFAYGSGLNLALPDDNCWARFPIDGLGSPICNSCGVVFYCPDKQEWNCMCACQ